MSKARTKALQFDKKAIAAICMRDKQCIFCRQQYHMENTSPMLYQINDIMHYINKSASGLGIEQNGVLGCRYHHGLLDNGNKGLREEMLHMMESHLRGIYPDWKPEALIYQKYGGTI